MRTVCIDPDFRKDNRDTVNPVCCRCQKSITTKSYRKALITSDGWTAIHPEDAALAAEDATWQPVGNNCAKIIGKEYTLEAK